MLTDPLFYLVAVPGVMLYGIAKGGFAGPAAVLAVPLMALVMPPSQAAAILLPILVVMDVVVVKTYWKIFDMRALQVLLPGALAGIFLGYLSFEYLNDAHLRIIVGLLSLVFGAQNLWRLSPPSPPGYQFASGSMFGAIAGFTSFSIHAGGPPLTMYLMPKRLDPLLFAGTSGIFFAVVNAVKLLPYYSLGQLGAANLVASLVLVPLAPLGVAIGHWAVRRTEPGRYYYIISFFLMVLGVTLLWEGASALLRV
ncbi:MAG: sulfite exporter TauE/SafE family protein [Halieaceae bacterium]|nr:sulfite exporter TauE/SafE family protein [Halieaceae bacterium]